MKADNRIREISKQNQYNKTVINKTVTNQGSEGVNIIQGKTPQNGRTDDGRTDVLVF